MKNISCFNSLLPYVQKTNVNRYIILNNLKYNDDEIGLSYFEISIYYKNYSKYLLITYVKGKIW